MSARTYTHTHTHTRAAYFPFVCVSRCVCVRACVIPKWKVEQIGVCRCANLLTLHIVSYQTRTLARAGITHVSLSQTSCSPHTSNKRQNRTKKYLHVLQVLRTVNSHHRYNDYHTKRHHSGSVSRFTMVHDKGHSFLSVALPLKKKSNYNTLT